MVDNVRDKLTDQRYVLLGEIERAADGAARSVEPGKHAAVIAILLLGNGRGAWSLRGPLVDIKLPTILALIFVAQVPVDGGMIQFPCMISNQRIIDNSAADFEVYSH